MGSRQVEGEAYDSGASAGRARGGLNLGTCAFERGRENPPQGIGMLKLP